MEIELTPAECDRGKKLRVAGEMFRRRLAAVVDLP